MSPHYAWEKLSASMSTLAEGTGQLRRRLYSAYPQFMRLRQDDLPPKLWERYSDIMQQLTGHLTRGESTVESAIRALSPLKARKIASEMFWLYDEVARRFGREQPSEER
jgi:hypothetical protein